MTESEVKRMLANPFYCINISPALCEKHEPLITEDAFIKAGVQGIKEIGAEAYLKELLENLKGNYV